MNPADRVAAARASLNLSATELAQQIGIEDAWFRDLESYADELETTLTMSQVIALSSLLKVTPHFLVFGEPNPSKPLNLASLPTLISNHIQQTNQSLSDFEESVGWELQNILTNPIESAMASPLMFYEDLSQHLGIPYSQFIP